MFLNPGVVQVCHVSVQNVSPSLHNFYHVHNTHSFCHIPFALCFTLCIIYLGEKEFPYTRVWNPLIGFELDSAKRGGVTAAVLLGGWFHKGANTLGCDGTHMDERDPDAMVQTFETLKWFPLNGGIIHHPAVCNEVSDSWTECGSTVINN
jgi:hypothetical protein